MKRESLPDLHKDIYNCPLCKTYCEQEHFHIQEDMEGNKELVYLHSILPVDLARIIAERQVISVCTICEDSYMWVKGKLVYPNYGEVPEPNDDLPEEIKTLYQEAASVFNLSPRSSAALLRLAIEKFLELEGYQGNLNKKISTLVTNGASDIIQKGLDAIRYYGNKGVHPGELDLSENKEDITYLFDLLNVISEEFITKPKRVNDFYSKLPFGFREHIDKRDRQTLK
ncbi:DUF4145 domain-containing protein [Bacillus gobiensis]|uniref:DUF4145 domain-containing protein n=1 Tax=Bacillus gobiensis TaxID=1441095 RepID=UPI0006AE386A|nr:DUF4145 domain-containing protein [Bacillus gobiensis]